MAAVITLHSVRLATNANGALLLTWLLDTCSFANRFKTLAPRLVPHLVKLCTHKLASLTVLKLINQRNEPEARDIILNALFNSDEENKILKWILEDQVHGAAVIYKVLTSPFVADQSSQERRSQLVSIVRNILQKLKVQPSQGYKRLMDEVGLADRSVATPPLNGHRPQRSTTPREYGQTNAYGPGAFYSPQHTYPPQQQYLAQPQIEILSRGQIDPSLLGMELQNQGQIYQQQQHQHQHQQPHQQQQHTHQDTAQAAYQYQQMMLLQQRSYPNYSPAPQQVYTPPQQQQFGGPLPGMGVYNTPNYPFQGDYNRRR
jgi:protein JSN1